MLDWMIVPINVLTLLMIIWFAPILIARIVTGVIHGGHPSFNTIEYFGFSIAVTYWVVRCTGVV